MNEIDVNSNLIITAVWSLSTPYFVVWQSLTRLNMLDDTENTSSMCCDLDAFVFLHVMCVVVGDEEDARFWKKELVIFISSDASKFSIDVPFLFLFSMPYLPNVSL